MTRARHGGDEWITQPQCVLKEIYGSGGRGVENRRPTVFLYQIVAPSIRKHSLKECQGVIFNAQTALSRPVVIRVPLSSCKIKFPLTNKCQPKSLSQTININDSFITFSHSELNWLSFPTWVYQVRVRPPAVPAGFLD